ncbi:MerR family transcriptional regulator [bacterium]|nr:MerR family transcriptional regulator [bacterium]
MVGPEIRRLYYSTKEVSEFVQIPRYILRMWETKFPQVKPSKSKSGRRLYKQKDLDALFQIKKLKDKGYTDDKVVWLIDHQQDGHRVEEANQEKPIPQIDKSRKMVFLFEMMNGLNEILRILNEK